MWKAKNFSYHHFLAHKYQISLSLGCCANMTEHQHRLEVGVLP